MTVQEMIRYAVTLPAHNHSVELYAETPLLAAEKAVAWWERGRNDFSVAGGTQTVDVVVHHSGEFGTWVFEVSGKLLAVYTAKDML